jgi:hypothetical protein
MAVRAASNTRDTVIIGMDIFVLALFVCSYFPGSSTPLCGHQMVGDRRGRCVVVLGRHEPLRDAVVGDAMVVSTLRTVWSPRM